MSNVDREERAEASGKAPLPTSHRALIPGRPDTLDVRQLWATLAQNQRFVFGVAIATFALVMSATLLARMQFRSVGRLYLGELEEGSSTAPARSNELAISANNQGVIGSEVEILQSRSLVSRAILDSGLNVEIKRAGAPPPRYGAWLLSRRNPALLDVAAAELRSKGSTLDDDYGKERTFRVRFDSDTQYELWADDRRLGTGRLGEPMHVAGAHLTLEAGSERSPRRGTDYELTIRPLPEVTDATLKALGVSAPKPLPPAQPVNVVTLEFSGHSPRLAARFLDRLMAAYLNERQSWKAEDATAAEAFVTDQLHKTRESLDQFEKKLADYRSANRVVVTDNEAKAMIEQIGKYEEQRVAARLEVAGLAELQKTLRSENPPVGALLLGGTTDTVIERMATSLSEARQRLTELDTRFNDTAPDVRAQREQVEAQLQSIRNYVASRAERARVNLGSIDSIIRQFEAKLNTVPGAEVGLAQLSRESDVYDRMYTYLLERQQQTAIIKASTLSKNRVLDAPEVSFREDSPKLLLRLASGPLGLLLGALLVLLRSFFAGSFQSESDVRAVLEGVPVYATVPRRGKARRGRSHGVAAVLETMEREPNWSFAEAFRMLRAHLYRQFGPGPGKALLISSPNEGDGKTTCALALAASLARDGKRVLLIDTDLRKPHYTPLHDSTRPEAGLRDVLLGQRNWLDLLRPVTVAGQQFFVLGSGGTAATELLSSTRMSELLKEARNYCDFVLLDTPSFPRASEALTLASAVDGALSVVCLENSSRKLALEHVRALGAVVPALCVVINESGQSRPLVQAERRIANEPPADRQPNVKWWRGRALWWVSGVLLIAGAAAFLLAHQSALNVFRSAIERRQ